MTGHHVLRVRQAF